MHEICIYLKIPNSKNTDRAVELFTSKAFWIGKSNAAVRHIFKTMVEENESNGLLKESILSSLTIRLIVEITRLYFPDETSSASSLSDGDLNESRSWILDQLLLEDCSNVTLDDFAKVQRRMVLAKKENAPETYADLKEEYILLKVLLNTAGVNLTEIDYIKE
jgi:hypothetical protein